MRLLLALLTACAVHFHCLDAAADEAGVWRAASGTLSITYGQAGWRLSDRRIEGALLVIAPDDEPAGPPVCALFAYPEQSLPGQINSQADVNEAIGRLSLARASQGHALVENANGLSIPGVCTLSPAGCFAISYSPSGRRADRFSTICLAALPPRPFSERLEWRRSLSTFG